jgi:hypothetical protein
MSEPSDNPVANTDQQTLLRQRQQFWLDMYPAAFLKLCVKQKLVSQGSTNKCYDSAANLYNIVHDCRTAHEPAFKSSLDCLEKLRDARVFVSADAFLRTRQLGLARDLPRGLQSELVDFVTFNNGLCTDGGIGKLSELCEKCRDFTLEGNTVRSAECASLASQYISEVKSNCLDNRPFQEMAEIISSMCQNTCNNLPKEKNDHDIAWRVDTLNALESNMGTLIAQLKDTSAYGEFQDTRSSRR